MNGGSLFHLTDEALRLVLLICAWHLSHLSFLTFALFCVSSCKGFVPLPAQNYDPSCWWHSGSCFWRPSVTLCYGYLKHELVALRHHAGEPGQKIVTLDVCARTRNLEFFWNLSTCTVTSQTSLQSNHEVDCKRQQIFVTENITNV